MIPMTFNELCEGCTLDERRKLAEYLAMLRMKATLKLAESPKQARSNLSKNTLTRSSP